MIAQVKVSSTTERKVITIESASTLNQVFETAGIVVSGDVTVNVNGVHSFRPNQLDTKLDDISGLDFNSQISVMAIVNAKNA